MHAPVFALSLFPSVHSLWLPDGAGQAAGRGVAGRGDLAQRPLHDSRRAPCRRAPGDIPAGRGCAGMDIAGRHAYPAGVQVPVVLYMHGCTGWSHQDDVYRTLLTAEGYAVFIPNSFARPAGASVANRAR